MERGALDVAGVRRTYWLTRGPDERAPLLVMLPGSGTSGRDVATTFTGLATRGPAAGVTVVFPDSWGGMWHVAGAPPPEPALDDAAFLRALVGRLQGTAEPQPVFLAGISNGAGFAEHVGRHGLLPLAGLFLVAGLILRRRAARNGDLPSQRRVVAVETVARDWAAANGISGEPASVRLADEAGDPPVTRLTWSAPGRPAGHALPGRGRRARLAGRAAVPARPGHRAYPPPPRRERPPAGGGWLIKTRRRGVSAGLPRPSELQRGYCHLPEALIMVESEQAGTGHA